MRIVRWTVPRELGFFTDWMHRLSPGTFDLPFAGLLGALEGRHGELAADPARQDEAGRAAAAVGWLKALPGGTADVGDGGVHGSLLWSEVADLICGRRFALVRCPSCGGSYRAEECRAEEWEAEADEGREAEGGRRLLCPAGHTLYGVWDWMG